MHSQGKLTYTLRKNKTIDWEKRDDARAKMRMMVKKLLKRYKYPPEGMDDAVQTVLAQCELWTDNVQVESIAPVRKQPDDDYGWLAASPKKTLKDN